MLYADPFLTVYCCLLAALLGACMGSFLNCAAWRIVHGESVLRGRSHCDACGHVLAMRDLIPVVSYLAAHGRCRYCGAKLSRRHVLAEAVSALVFVTLLLHYDISLQALEGWCVAGILLVCSFADLEGYIIPDRFIAVGVVLFIITLFFAPQPLRRALDGAIGGLAVAGCVLLLVLGMEKLLGREAMGGGDIKLLFLTGLFLGWKRNLLCLVAACAERRTDHKIPPALRKKIPGAGGSFDSLDPSGDRLSCTWYVWWPSLLYSVCLADFYSPLYFRRVARPPRICRWALFSSRTCFT